MTPYQRHVARWSACTACPLHHGRKHVVLARGRLPCDVLFVGEAPGESEDVLGRPFVGPAGKLLDRIIESALPKEVTRAWTNLVCCIPRTGEGDKAGEPPKECIEACAERLRELVALARPKLVVHVGALATRYVPRSLRGEFKVSAIDITHPAAILRMNVAQQGLAIQRCVVAIADAVSP